MQKYALNCLIYGCFFFYSVLSQAQRDKTYWQQEVRYTMEVNLNTATHQFTGEQIIRYRNNSPDELTKVFFHLYLNAFQPGSAMDVRSRNLPDPDPRIGDRISTLSPSEQGFQIVKSLKQNGKPVAFETVGTILEVHLAKPIPPGGSSTFEMVYEAQVPLQIRRNGRDNAEGISYSMSQWYPKLCEYDHRGWHAHPYIGREFYGVWGDFDVKITLDASYMVAAGGVAVGAPIPVKNTDAGKNLLQWHFKAQNVHDFVWAADPDYVHDTHACKNGVILHAYYQPAGPSVEFWKRLLPIMEEAINYMNLYYGKYPYPMYAFIQGGDGGMEYPMATLITGHRGLNSLVGVSIHELVHSWFQMIYGFNESYYYWMDEGFTNYVSELVTEHLKAKKLLPGEPDPNPMFSFYKGYSNLISGGLEEPLCTHADQFESSAAYGIAAYSKGAVFLHQLQYIIGKPAFDQGMLDFFEAWKFKHPDDVRFLRVMEKRSGLELDWYLDYMVHTFKYIDYGIDTVLTEDTGATIVLSRNGLMPMPLDVEVELQDGKRIYYTIPLDLMRGHKNENAPNGDAYVTLPDWNWVNPIYTFSLPFETAAVKAVRIDPTERLADQFSSNNQWPPSGL